MEPRTPGTSKPEMIDTGLVGSTDFHASRDHTLVGPLGEGYHESRRCSRDTYPESYITKNTIVYEDTSILSYITNNTVVYEETK